MSMATLGKFSKGFPLEVFRRFPKWTENLENARKMRKEVEGDTVEVARELTDSDYLYLQENFTVTDSIFLDENIIFNDVTPEWIDFCVNVLGIKFPGTESK
jgi:hypothetical protein